MAELTRAYDLEERLIDFAVRVIRIAQALPKTEVGRHVCGQITRSGTSAAPNYGEAQGAESRADFIHKMRIALKELRETKVWLKIIKQAGLIEAEKLKNVLDENDELIAIFAKSLKTAGRKSETTS